MKLIKFNTKNVAGGQRLSSPTITFGSKGAITLSKAAVEKLQLKAGDKISLLHDEENPGDWYITRDEEGYKLREKDGGYLSFNNSALCHIVRENLDLAADVSHCLPIATEPAQEGKQVLYAILTASLEEQEQEEEEEEDK